MCIAMEGEDKLPCDFNSKIESKIINKINNGKETRIHLLSQRIIDEVYLHLPLQCTS
jgi:hypothetical protein